MNDELDQVRGIIAEYDHSGLTREKAIQEIRKVCQRKKKARKDGKVAL